MNSQEKNEIQKFIINSNCVGERLDLIICKKKEDLTRSFLHKMFLNKKIFVNGVLANKNYRVKVGDEVKIIFSQPESFDVVAQNIPLDVVYEDEFLLVVNKPKGMVVHPAPGHYSNTLVNALMWHCKNCLSNVNGILRPGIVHRIDQYTSGLLVVAKTNEAYYSLSNQIKEHSIDRIYEAIVYGNFNKLMSGTLAYPIGRSVRNRKKMSVNFKTGKNAVTHFKVIEQFKNFAHVQLKLQTGRTHQIRVHMSYVGHPVVGDEVYGPKNEIKLNGQCLHAKTLGFFHFKLKKRLLFHSELDLTFKNFLNFCKKL